MIPLYWNICFTRHWIVFFTTEKKNLRIHYNPVTHQPFHMVFETNRQFWGTGIAFVFLKQSKHGYKPALTEISSSDFSASRIRSTSCNFSDPTRIQHSVVLEKQDRAWFWKGYFITEMFTLQTKKHYHLFLPTFLVKCFSSFQVYICIKEIGGFFMRKGDPKVFFDWKVKQRGKCIPVKSRVCWIMKAQGFSDPCSVVQL